MKKKVFLFIFLLFCFLKSIPVSSTANNSINVNSLKNFLLERGPKFNQEKYLCPVGQTLPITIITPKNTIKSYTSRVCVSDALLENNILFDDLDIIKPKNTSLVTPNLEIKLIDVEKKYETIQEKVPFTIEYKENSKLSPGAEVILQEGKDGERIADYEIIFHDGKEHSRKMLSEKILQNPIPKIISVKYQYLESGNATFYNENWTLDKFLWRKWARGSNLFAAHKTLPIGTKVLVVNDYQGKHYGKSVIVTIIDRGPYGKGRVIDLSYWAFEKISSHLAGYTPVKLYKIADPDPN